MAAARRAQKAEALAADVAAMEAAAADAAAADADGDGDGAAEALAAAGFADVESLRAALAATSARLRRLRGDEGGGEGEEGEEAAPAAVDDSVKYPLLAVPDAELDAEQLRAKRRQRLLKGGEEARARARAAKAAAAAAEAAEAAAEAARFAAQPDAVLAELRGARADIERRVEARKARRLGGSAAAAGAPRRGGEAQRERMRLMAAAAGAELPAAGGPGGKRRRGGGGGDEDDTFGADDADWDVYRRIDRDGSDSEAERADDAALAKVCARLAAFEAQRREEGLDVGGEGLASEAQLAPELDWNTAEAHQIWLGVERIRAPEILFQPAALAGIDQAGLAEAIAVALQRAPSDARARLRAAPLLLTGGGAAMAGMAARLQAELVAICEPGNAMRGAALACCFFQRASILSCFLSILLSTVVLSSDTPWLDAWRGASLCAAAALTSPAATTAAEWAEGGASGLRRKPPLRYAPDAF